MRRGSIGGKNGYTRDTVKAIEASREEQRQGWDCLTPTEEMRKKRGGATQHNKKSLIEREGKSKEDIDRHR